MEYAKPTATYRVLPYAQTEIQAATSSIMINEASLPLRSPDYEYFRPPADFMISLVEVPGR